MDPLALVVATAAAVLVGAAFSGLIALKLMRTAASALKWALKVAVGLGLLAGLVLAGGAALLFLT